MNKKKPSKAGLIILMGIAGLAVYIQTKTLYSYAEHAIPSPEVIKRMAEAKGSVVNNSKESNEEIKSKECSECMKKPQPPEWMKEKE